MSFWSCRAAVVAAVVLLCGCAAERMFNEGRDMVSAGQTLEGFAKIEAAIKEDPKNTEYRVYLTNRREAAITSLLARADLARSQGRLADAETAYREVLALDSRNQPAQVGMERLVGDRRHKQQMVDAEALFKKDDLRGAGDIVRTILSENPQQREARNLDARITEKMAKQVKPDLKLAESFRKPVSLEFRDAPLRSVFEVIARVSGFNFVYDKDIRPDLKVTIFVKNSSIEDAIKILSVTNQLEYRVLNENSILIYPNTPQKIKDYQPLVVRSFYLANTDAKQVANTLKTILKTKDLVINEKLNMLIMRDTADAVRLAEKIVSLEDLNEPEVMLEVEVLEIKRSKLQELGVKWPDQLTLSVPAGTSLYDLRHLTSSSVDASLTNAVISAKKDDTDANILANPRIRVKNREKAKILIGDRVPVITTTSTSTGFVADSVNYVDVGLKLEVEPNIYLDDEVSMKVQLEVSNIVKEVVSRSGTQAYQIGTRNANTVLRLRDGETQVLAGLISDEDRKVANKVPGLGDLPIVGRLFSRNKDETQKTEIVLSITPRLVRTIRRPEMLNAEFESGTETSLGGRPLAMSAAAEPAGKGKAEGTGATGKAPATGGAGTAAPAAAPQQGQTAAQAAAAASAVTGGAASDTGVRPVVAPEVSETANSPPKTSSSIVDGVTLAWQGPQQVRSGEQFSTVLRMQSGQSINGVAGLVAFDPAYVQVVGVSEGDFFGKGGVQTNFSSRVDPVSGKVFIVAIRQGGAINGAGTLATVTFKAVKSGPQTAIQVLSMTPEPEGSVAPVPLEHVLSVN